MSDRTVNSLSHRWSVIQEGVNKFCGYYDGVMRRAPSGSTDSSKVTMALGTFEEGEGNKFKLLHCWEVLNGKRKWTERLSAKKQKGIVSPSATDGAESMEGSQLGPRLMGRKRAKEARCTSSSIAMQEVPAWAAMLFVMLLNG